MQSSKKVKDSVKEIPDIIVNWQSTRKEIDSMNTTIKTLQIAVNRILKLLKMKSYTEEFRERMDRIQKRDPI
ncbi:MAG: hypothetical protein ACFFEN_03955 [Candidatus Thorarchaeota archaeon]